MKRRRDNLFLQPFCIASHLIFIVLFSSIGKTAYAQQVIPLYADEVPNAISSPNRETGDADATIHVSQPTLTVFLPQKNQAVRRPAIIICPGGGYGSLVMDREGYRVAERFAQMGFVAFVLKYRLPDPAIMQAPSEGPLQDAQQAVKLVRQRSSHFHIDVHKVGMMGFSAGGHLAATAATRFKKPVIQNADGANLRPDFLVLVYPVISFRSGLVHQGSMQNLLGKDTSVVQRSAYSAEQQVDENTPPSFLVHATDDVWVPPGNSIAFYEALQKHGIDAELHLYAKGGHGFMNYPPQQEWLGRCMAWLKLVGFAAYEKS